MSSMKSVQRVKTAALGRGGVPAPCVPDQHTKGGPPAVRKLLSSVVSELVRPVCAVDVVTAIDQCLPLPDLVTCLNPLCDHKCSWSKSAGRPREYCSRSCRQSALRTHARLTEEVMLIEQVLAQGSVRYTDRVRLEAHAAQARWCLRRYATGGQ